METLGLALVSNQVWKWLYCIKRLNNHQERVCIPCFIRWRCQSGFSDLADGHSSSSLADKIRLQINKRMGNGKNRDHSSIAAFQDTFQGVSCPFRYLLHCEFRAEPPPIPVYNSSSEREIHLCSSARGGGALVPAGQLSPTLVFGSHLLVNS